MDKRGQKWEMVRQVRSALGFSFREAVDAIGKYGTAEAALAALGAPEARDAFESQYDRPYRRTNELDAQLAASISTIKEMREALEAIVASWDKRGGRQEKHFTDPDLPNGYWSPAASMVSSEHIAAARSVLTKYPETNK